MNNSLKNTHEYWMRIALQEAEQAIANGEIPVAAILVADGQELARAQTQVSRRGSIVAHGEFFALLEAGARVWTAKRPLIIYSTLEPCLMCLGAAMQAEVDEVVYAMDAAPDGGTRFQNDIIRGNQKPPRITRHVLQEESVALMKQLLVVNPGQPAVPYVKAMLAAYQQRIGASSGIA